MRSLKPLAFLPTLFVALICAAPLPLKAQAPAASATIDMIAETDIDTAAAECGIGAHGEKVEPAVAAAALPPLAIGVAKWALGLVAGHLKGVVQRRLGWDQEYRRFLAISRQLDRIEAQLKALNQRFDRLEELLQAQELRAVTRDLETRYLNPVSNGTHALHNLVCADAAVANLMHTKQKLGDWKMAHRIAVSAFRDACRRTEFENIPANLTTHLLSSESILKMYNTSVIVPRRYLTQEDSKEFDNLFSLYYLSQIESLRLRAECLVRFPPKELRRGDGHDAREEMADEHLVLDDGPIQDVDPAAPNESAAEKEQALREVVANLVYRNRSSDFQRAQLGTLLNIMPQILPEDVVLDLKSGLLWWNGTQFGVHPFVDRRGVFKLKTIAETQDVAGFGKEQKETRRFELAKIKEVVDLAAFDTAVPTTRRNRPQSGKYPATLTPFLREIGLGKLAEKIPDSGNLSYVWTSDIGRPIRRCYSYYDDLGCTKWYDAHENLGESAGTAPANRTQLLSDSGNVFWAPVQCSPNPCKPFPGDKGRVISLCKRPTGTSRRNQCIPDAVLGMWQAPGIYRAVPLKEDRFSALDLAAVRAP